MLLGDYVSFSLDGPHQFYLGQRGSSENMYLLLSYMSLEIDSSQSGLVGE